MKNKTVMSCTFSLSVPNNFLSSLFFNFPGASAMGRDEWKMISFPAIPACYKRNGKKEVKFVRLNEKKRSSLTQREFDYS